MFTPQKKGWFGWSLSRRVGDRPAGESAPVNPRSADGPSLGKAKEKSVAEAPPSPPPQAWLDGNGGEAAGGAGYVEAWRRFRDEGLLNESMLQRKEKEALVQRLEELKKELKKALHEVCGEIAEVKYTSDKKFADAHALEARLEEKYLKIEGKLHSADAKLAEASRKSSEIDRKLDDVEACERELQMEYLSLNTERKTYQKDLDEQREHLREWEKSLLESQKRLLAGQRLINDREERANETDRFLMKKEEQLKEAQKMMEVSKNSLKEKEADISNRRDTLACKEKEANIKIENLEKKEKELLAIEGKLNAKERVEIQKLLNDHNATLNSKKQEFELELEHRRKSINEEMKGKLDAVDKKKIEVDRKEEQIINREQFVEIKIQSLKQQEKDLDTKSKALKKWEESIQIDEKKLEEEKQQIGREMQELVKSRTELENLKATVEAAKQQMIKEEENLKLTDEEREQHLLLQSKLKQEIEDCRMTKELLLKEREDLRELRENLRENFEKEWDALDEKKVELKAQVKKIIDEREKFEKWRHNEEERLNNEVLAAKANIQREFEDLRLKKETFERRMELEKSNAFEELKMGRADIARELELRKHDLKMNMHKKREDMEKQMQEKEKQFNRWRDKELNQINSVKTLNESKCLKLKVEQDQFEREKQEFSMHRKKLESDQLEIQNDIETLRVLSRNLKDQRDQFIKEKEHFVVLAEQCKICKKSEGEANCEPAPSYGVPNDIFDAQRVQSDSGIRANKESERLVRAGDDIELSFGIADNSTDIQVESEQIIPSIGEHNERKESSMPSENDSQPKPLKQKGGQAWQIIPSVKAVVEDAKTVLGETSKEKYDGPSNGVTKDSLNIQEESLGDSVHADAVATNSRQKRRLDNTSGMTIGELDVEDSETHSESTSLRRHRKRHRISAPETETPGEKRCASV